MKELAFPKAHRICRKLDFQHIFNQGQSHYVYPVKMLYVMRPDAGQEAGVKVGVIVPKRLFRHAVARNRLKRLLREAYRLNQRDLTEKAIRDGVQWQLLFIYTAQRMHAFHKVEDAVKNLINSI